MITHMKQVKQGAFGLLHLSEGITHIIGFKVSGFHASSKAEFKEGQGTFLIETTSTRIENAEKVEITVVNAPIDTNSLQMAEAEAGGIIIQLVRTSESFYIQPHSLEAVEGLDQKS